MTRDGSTNGVWLYGSALLLVLIVAAGGLYLSISGHFAQGELGTKSYYAVLQGLVLDADGKKGVGPVLRENVNGSELNVLGVPEGDPSGTRVWVILNRASPEGQPMVMPRDASMKVECSFVRDLITVQHVVDPVRLFLLKNCT